MSSIYIYIIIAFVTGFVIAWIIRTLSLIKTKKALKSVQGFFEQEQRINETLKHENKDVHDTRVALRSEFDLRVKELQRIIKRMDEDILLLQKSNEETENLLKAGNPEIHALKLQLIDAQNTIVRYKARLGQKENNEAQ